ncbi:MAG: hypothetical protein CMH64_01750 [Nanoarchaeota archaeon]|nr:hypothetical protein [Nanoarchaeota archaeon]
MFSIMLVYAVTTSLTTPTDNTEDTDGFIDFTGSCTPASGQNITQAVLYTDIGGSWVSNQTLTSDPSVGVDAVYYANFSLNRTPQGSFEWNIECTDNSSSNFAGNNTVRVVFSQPTIVTTSPADNTYSMNGNDIDVVCTADPSANWNITTVSLMTNIGGDWKANSTHTPSPDSAVESAQVVANFTINGFDNASIADGTDLLYSCYASQETSELSETQTSNTASTNRTLNVEYPPTTTLNGPTTDSWSATRVVNLSWTTSTTFDSGTTILTRVWTNESGVWAVRTGTIEVTNNTQYDHNYNFDELTDIRWAIEAIQYSDSSVRNTSDNRTIKISATTPTITISTGNLNTSDTTPTITGTLGGANLETFVVYTNSSSNGAWIANNTNESVVAGVTNLFNNTAFADGVYKYGVTVNNSGGTSVESTNYSLIIDTTMPTISAVTNVSVADKCDQRAITFTSSEITNATLTYDTDTDVSDGTVVSSATLTTSHSLVLDFDYNGEVTYYFNITTEDSAGNNNQTHGQTTYLTPARVCTGWNQYAVYDSFINLSDIQNQSGADLVYFWNATNQNWVYMTAGLGTNDEVIVGKKTAYQIVHLYENTNSTWYRNITDYGVYDYNVSSVNNFVSVPTDFTFGNLTQSFMNASILDAIYYHPSTTTDDLTFNITLFAGWNNSLQDYVSHIYNFTWSNSTLLEPCPNRVNTDTCMEAVWVASNFNVTWNASSISRNWTI